MVWVSHFAYENMITTSQSATTKTLLKLLLCPLLLEPAAERGKTWIREQERFFLNNYGNYICISRGRFWEFFLKGWKEFLLLISILSQRKSN